MLASLAVCSLGLGLVAANHVILTSTGNRMMYTGWAKGVGHCMQARYQWKALRSECYSRNSREKEKVDQAGICGEKVKRRGTKEGAGTLAQISRLLD